VKNGSHGEIEKLVLSTLSWLTWLHTFVLAITMLWTLSKKKKELLSWT